MPRISRSFILHLVKNCEEARPGLDAWRAGEMTWEEAMMETVKQLLLAKGNLQRRLWCAESPKT